MDASKKDDDLDENNDGVPDVQQMEAKDVSDPKRYREQHL
jgi:hypothetical protein